MLRLWGTALVALAISFSTVAQAEPEAETEPESAPDTEPARPPHPEPRVIVTVSSVRGPHKRSDVERAARLGWGRIVRCYKKSGNRKTGVISMELGLSGGGAVTASRARRSTFANREISSCVAHAMRGVAMPQAARGSTAKIDIKLAPGDAPE